MHEWNTHMHEWNTHRHEWNTHMHEWNTHMHERNTHMHEWNTHMHEWNTHTCLLHSCTPPTFTPRASLTCYIHTAVSTGGAWKWNMCQNLCTIGTGLEPWPFARARTVET
jgi:hypothetical protein